MPRPLLAQKRPDTARCFRPWKQRCHRLSWLVLAAALAPAHFARAATTTTYTLNAPNGGTWTNPTSPWVATGGDATGTFPNRAGDVAIGTTSGIVVSTVLDAAITLGSFKENFGTSWTITTSGSFGFTFDGTGLSAADNGFGNANVASIVNSSGGSNFTIRPNIVLANTDLDIGYTGSTTGNGQLNIGTLGTSTITSLDSATRTLTLRSNSKTAATGAITINSSIGATGSAINISNQSTGSGATLTLAGAIGGAAGTGATINISNTATGTDILTISGSVGASVSTITQNSATSRMIFSGTSAYAGVYTVTNGILQFNNRTSLYSADTSKWNATNIALNTGATLAFAIGGAGQFTMVDINTFVGTGNTSTLFPAGTRLGLDTSAVSAGFNYTSVIGDANGGANSVGLTKLGSNTLTLSAANTYSGPTTISGGTLSLGAIQGDTTGPLGKSAGGLPTNTIFFNGGTLQFTAANTTDYSSRFSGANNNAISIDTNGQTVTFASVITSSGGSVAKIGAGTLILSAANTFTGGTFLSGGATSILQGSDSTAYSAATNTLKTVFGTSTINVTSGILQLRANGNNDATSQTLTYGNLVQDTAASSSFTIDVDQQAAIGGTNKTILMGGLNNAANVTVNVTGGHGFVLGLGAISLGGGATTSTMTLNPTSASIVATGVSGGSNSKSPTLELGGTSTGNAITGVAANNASGATSILKSNSSTWTLSGANTYSGGTTINQGTLLINNTSGSGTGSGAVVVSGTLSGKLGGTGTILAGANSVTVNSGAFLSPGNGSENTLAGVGKLSMTFTTGGLNLLSNSKFVFDLATTVPGTGSDLVNLTAGALTLNGQAFSDFTFNTLAGFDVGTYTLFQTTKPILGSLDANAVDLTGAVGTSGLTGTLAISGNNLVLMVVPEPGSLAMLLSGLGSVLGLSRFRLRRTGRVS